MLLALTHIMPFTLSQKNSICLVLLFICTTVGMAQKSKDSLVTAIQTFETTPEFNGEDASYVDLLADLAYELRYYKKDSMFLLSEKSLHLSKTLKYKLGESRSLFNLGSYYSDIGESAKAVTLFKQALALAEKIEANGFLVRIHNELSGEFAYMGDFAQALNGYLKGIEEAERFNDQEMLSIINENIANLYTSQKDFKQALEFYKKVKRINAAIGNEIYTAETMSNMASLYADMNELEYAKFNVNASISVFEKHEIMDWLAYAYEIKGKTYLKEDRYKWALYWYRQSEAIHQKIQDERGKIDLYNGMAEAFFGIERDSISKDYAMKAYDISIRIKFLEGTQKCANTLYKISKKNKDFATALQYHELYNTLSDTLYTAENKKSLTMFKTKLEYETQKKDLIIQNEKALAKQKNYMYGALGVLIVFLVVNFLIRRNENIQKKLNVELNAKKLELEKRELDLREINLTKDKLFSIIGHDLRGPIGAFQGLLKLYKEGEIKQKEFLGFIPKLGTDLDHISFTLNNLLSWGQTQMNGSITKPSIISLDSLVSDNIKLLSEIANNKSIRIVSRLSANTLAWVDGDQIDIVIRNLLSNAIKFTSEHGIITVGAAEKNNHWEIYVRDTGIGMDLETQEKIFANNSNLTTYGTNNEKGTGLGLSLCKEMIQKNNGSIWVDSIPRKGSCFYFTLPKAKKEYQKTA
ncbi:MAG: ATP-binding protein [Flavobacteriaceae bacterium]